MLGQRKMRIRLRTIFFAVTILAIASMLLGWYVNQCRTQQAFVKWCISNGAEVGFADNAGFQSEPPGYCWKLIGREGYFPVSTIVITITNERNANVLLDFLLENRDVLVFVEFTKEISIEFANKFVGFNNLHAYRTDENNIRLKLIDEGKKI